MSVFLSSSYSYAQELDLPELGDRVSGAVSVSQERAIGQQFLKQVYSQAPLISDPLLFDYTDISFIDFQNIAKLQTGHLIFY